MTEQKVIETQKTQIGRAWSIFVFALILLIVAFVPKLPMYVRVILIIMGILTITTNWKRFNENLNR